MYMPRGEGGGGRGIGKISLLDIVREFFRPVPKPARCKYRHVHHTLHTHTTNITGDMCHKLKTGETGVYTLQCGIKKINLFKLLCLVGMVVNQPFSLFSVHIFVL